MAWTKSSSRVAAAAFTAISAVAAQALGFVHGMHLRVNDADQAIDLREVVRRNLDARSGRAEGEGALPAGLADGWRG